MFNIGSNEIFVVAIIIIIILFSNKLPEITRSFTQALKEFRKALRGDYDSKEKDQK